MTDICFIDCESTGLDPERHVPWEIGLVLDGVEYQYVIPSTPEEMSRADPQALKLTRYYERTFGFPYEEPWCSGTSGVIFQEQRTEFATFLTGKIGTRHLAGNVVSFDARMVGDFLRRHGAPPIWHYHLIDVECIVAGRLGISPPWKSEELFGALGIDSQKYERHTALGDALWARDVYEAAMAR